VRFYVNQQAAIERELQSQERDTERALVAAAKKYGISARWMRACVSSEGGFGHIKWNGGKLLRNYPLSKYPSSGKAPPKSSGALGPGQFMSGTFYAYVKYTKVPAKYKKWDSRVGQMRTMAIMFKQGKSSHWTGPGCRR
jgi:hypothetical protein